MSTPEVLTILRRYAEKADPTTLPLAIRFAHTVTSLTVFDAFPKSIFHLLVLPRLNVSPTPTAKELNNLRTLLRSDKQRAKELLLSLKKDALDVKTQIEEEMLRRFGFKWQVWMGFHAVSSMEHLHLHVISSDFIGSGMKTKKHYNSFHPQQGYFLHLDDVLDWFDAEPSFFSSMSKLKTSTYYPLLKEELVCWRCDREIKNMPTLKDHLKEEFDKEAKKERARLERKRKREEARAQAAASPKKHQAETHTAAVQPDTADVVALQPEERTEPANEHS